jgi:hypothetical protein
MSFMCTQYHTTEGCSTNYSDVDEDKHQAGEKEMQPQTGTSAGEDSIWGLPKRRCTAAKLSTVALRGINKNETPSISKDSTLLSVLMFYYTGVINRWWNKPVSSTVLGLAG